MIVRVPEGAGVDIWAVAGDGRRLTGTGSGTLEVPDGAVLEVRGRRRRQARLAWLAEVDVPVVSVDVQRSEVAAFDLVAVASIPHLAVLTASGAAIDGQTVEAIARAPSLAVLQLNAPSLRRGELLSLRTALRLRQVRLDVPNVPPEEVVEAMGERSLVAFGMSQPRLTALLLDQVLALWPLRELSVAVQYIDSATMSALRRLTSLRQLAIDGSWTELTVWDVTALVTGLPELGELDVTESGRQVSPDLLVGAWWVRPGLRINGLAMDATATGRFVERWSGDQG